uniref:Uncharacterized protein n=1 Tax=Ditylenchus dipsaci TaxID=166011 RepID=A0A915E3C6_9BILA
MTHSGPHNCIPLPTNCKSSLQSHPTSTPHSMTSKHLRIRQRIPLTNPRMAPSPQVMPEQIQKPVMCGRGSSSSSNSICSGSTSTTYKTTLGSTEYGSVGSGNSSSTPSSNGCQQFPIFTPVNIGHNQKDRMNTGVKSSSNDSYQQHHQMLLGVSHGECGKREASPYDVPPGASRDSDSKRGESSTTYRLVTPMVDNKGVSV